MTSLDDFAAKARQFCDWAQGTPSTVTVSAEMLMARRYLSSLYAMAADLPRFESNRVERTLLHDDWSMTFQRFATLPVGYYGNVCNPLEVPADETALGDLADDLADIWRDLKEGLLLFDESDRDAAGFNWQESFNTHWGTHAANALAVVHVWLTQNR